jgi:hypothetical protein
MDQARGSVILVEPSEASEHAMAMIYQLLVDELIGEAYPALIAHFRTMIRDYNARFGIPEEKPWTSHLDDKWFFSKSYFRDVTPATGLVLESFLPSDDAQGPMIAATVMST